jgi:hypothetical protein
MFEHLFRARASFLTPLSGAAELPSCKLTHHVQGFLISIENKLTSTDPGSTRVLRIRTYRRRGSQSAQFGSDLCDYPGILSDPIRGISKDLAQFDEVVSP